LYGALFGGLLGSATLFQRSYIGLPLGIGIGSAYGLCFAVGGWTVGWLLIRLTHVRRKGMALGLGVAISAGLFLIVFWALGGTLHLLLITTPSVVGAMVGIWRGRFYDRAATN